MAPLVPMVTAISPLRNAFTPIFESTPSLAPITNFVFGEIPISLQYSEAHPVKISCVDTRRDNLSALIPATSRAESSHSSFSDSSVQSPTLSNDRQRTPRTNAGIQTP